MILQKWNITIHMYSVVMALVSVITDTADPVIQHDSTLTRSAYYLEFMATSSWHRFYVVVRMERQAFFHPLDILKTVGNKHVDAGEKIM